MPAKRATSRPGPAAKRSMLVPLRMGWSHAAGAMREGTQRRARTRVHRRRANKPAAPGQQHLVGARLKKKQVPGYPLRCGAVGSEREAVCAGAASRAASRTSGIATLSRGLRVLFGAALDPVVPSLPRRPGEKFGVSQSRVEGGRAARKREREKTRWFDSMSYNSAASAFCLLPRALRGAYDDAGGGSDDTGTRLVPLWPPGCPRDLDRAAARQMVAMPRRGLRT